MSDAVPNEDLKSKLRAKVDQHKNNRASKDNRGIDNLTVNEREQLNRCYEKEPPRVNDTKIPPDQVLQWKQKYQEKQKAQQLEQTLRFRVVETKTVTPETIVDHAGNTRLRFQPIVQEVRLVGK